MFRATPCSSSGESIVSIQPVVYVTLCRWPFRVQVGKFPIWIQLNAVQHWNISWWYWIQSDTCPYGQSIGSRSLQSIYMSNFNIMFSWTSVCPSFKSPSYKFLRPLSLSRLHSNIALLTAYVIWSPSQRLLKHKCYDFFSFLSFSSLLFLRCKFSSSIMLNLHIQQRRVPQLVSLNSHLGVFRQGTERWLLWN